jgi:hypothetical protein
VPGTDWLSVADEMLLKTQMPIPDTDSISHFQKSSNERVFTTQIFDVY